MATENSGAATEPQQITVEQLAAQLSRKAPPGAKAEGQTPEAGAPDPETTVTEEAPVTEATGTEPDLFQSASTTESGTAEAGNVADAEPGGEAEAEAEAEPGIKPGTPEWFQKRVARFAAKQKALEDRLAAAEKRAEESSAKLDEARRNGKPKAWNFQEQQLQAQLGHKREVLRWAEENPEGATLTDNKGNEVAYSPEQVRAIKLSALEDLGDLRSQLRDHQAGLTNARAHWDAEALKAYPALKDPNSEESKNVELILDKLPWLREVPDARMSMADMLAGRAARLKKASGAPAATRPTPSRVPAAASAAPARSAETGPTQEVKQAKDAFFQSGRTQDLARRFAAERKV